MEQLVRFAVKEYQKENDGKFNYVVLETAHPAKFLDVFSDEIKSAISFPEKLKECLQKEKRSVKIPNDFNIFKNYLLEKN